MSNKEGPIQKSAGDHQRWSAPVWARVRHHSSSSATIARGERVVNRTRFSNGYTHNDYFLCKVSHGDQVTGGESMHRSCTLQITSSKARNRSFISFTF